MSVELESNSSLNKETIEELLEQGYLVKSKHNYLPLTIHNYSQTCQYEGYWNETTLACRGLVLDDNYEVVARGFPKFFNYSEHKGDLPSSDFEVTEKADGSLLLVFKYKDELVFATRGSFNSDQALEARKIWEEKYSDVEILEGYTYLFELIYPENRIVLDYKGFRGCIFLAILDKAGKDVKLRFEFPIKINKLQFTIDEILEIDLPDKEGFVVRFECGLRLKFKQEEYVRLHKIITNASTLTIWEALRDNIPFDQFLEKVPDEFYAFVKKTKESLLKQFNEIDKEIDDWLTYVLILTHEGQLVTRKDQALWIIANVKPKHYQDAVLNKLSGKDISKPIWMNIRPKYHKPFFKEE